MKICTVRNAAVAFMLLYATVLSCSEDSDFPENSDTDLENTGPFDTTDGDADSDADGDADTDSDSDADTDTDVDSDADGDTDTSGDSDAGPTCDDDAGISPDATEAYGAGAVRVVHAPISCGAGSTVEQDNGPPQNRINLILVGDGYTAAELTDVWPDHVAASLAVMFGPNTEPYGTYQKFINVCRLNVASNESGVDLATGNWPPSSYTYSLYRDTAFDGVCNEENRLGTMDENKVRQAVSQTLSGTGIDADWIGGILNTNRWCNAGGSIAFWAGYTTPLDVAFHESGHSWHGLADEYGGEGAYTGQERPEVNVTIHHGGKWPEWEGYNQTGIGVIGWYEGAYYRDAGIYRPSSNAKMNWVGYPHNAVCMQKMVRDIYDLVRPVDAWTDNRQPLVNPCRIQIRLVDAAQAEVRWFVNDVETPVADPETLSVPTLNLEAGTHDVRVEVSDPTLLVRSARTGLAQTVSWTIEL